MVITTYYEASNTGWGGIFIDKSGNSVEVRDYWSSLESTQPIIIRKALALKNILMAGASSLAASRVDAQVDTLPLVRAWSNQGGKSKALSDVNQAIYEGTLQFNIGLSLVYVPSRDTLADAPSRALSSSDCMLSPCVWKEIEKRCGLHSVCLMASDSNAPFDAQGSRLRRFTAWPTKDSDRVNVFCQILHHLDNAYVVLPLALVWIVLRFLASQPCPFIILVPDLFPRRYWWPVISGSAQDSVRLGVLGDHDMLLFPTSEGELLSHPLPWDIWEFRVST